MIIIVDYILLILMSKYESYYKLINHTCYFFLLHPAVQVNIRNINLSGYTYTAILAVGIRNMLRYK